MHTSYTNRGGSLNVWGRSWGVWGGSFPPAPPPLDRTLQAEKLVQWTLAIKSSLVDGESLFQAILRIRDAVNTEVEENTVKKRTTINPYI